jgi:hypothetical protein
MPGRLIGQVKYGSILQANTGDVIAGVAGYRIRVLAMFLSVSGAMSLQFFSGSSGTSPASDLTGHVPLATNGSMVLPFNEMGWFQTALGDALHLAQSTPGSLGGSITYVLVP